MKVNLSLELRQLLENEAVREVVTVLHQKGEHGGKTFIYMPLVNKCISDFYSHPADDVRNMMLQQEGRIPDYCFNQLDYQLLEELQRLGILKILYQESGFDDNSSWIAHIKTISLSAMKKIYQWMQDNQNKRIFNYGIFSLNIYTGEAYCKDNQYIFRPHRGMFKIFKAFLENQRHELSYEEIYAISQNKAKEETEDADSAIKITVQQNIGDIKERLGMKGKLAKLFVPTGMSYMLHPGLS